MEPNGAYFPISIDGKSFGARKYFYPLTNTFDCFYGQFDTAKTVALHVSKRVLTLLLSAYLPLEDVDRICDILIRVGKKMIA